ncbi:tetratricopeptide repeat protein [Actinoallomurus soli]|uniref:tetratricopeptide repeat protein n=1 Tax=Actinoallomurus soli TaxID=2952535 RepID=UPI0020938F33|nr:tetratricopeptide repeat protein [Actinoallomurus soli]MCO5973808.1 tetratricopeptide repeat protein [Actinoallomurus soli]
MDERRSNPGGAMDAAYGSSDPEHGPYVGERPFTEDDHAVFFGRSSEAEEIAELWLSKRLTILLGPSGCGKTSVLSAGVVPLLRAKSVGLLPVGRISHGSEWFPMAALPERNPYTPALLASWWPDESPTRVSPLSITEFLHRRQETDRRRRRTPFLVAIDQVERLYRRSDPRPRLRLVEELREAMEALPRTHLLLSAREEHQDDVLHLAKELGGESAPPFLLRPLDRGGALEAVIGPMAVAGRSCDGETAEWLVDDLQTIASPGASPAVEPVLLQVLCRRLWDDLPGGADTVSPRLAPNLDRVLADFCRRTLAAVAADHGPPPAILLEWLRQNILEPQHGADAGHYRIVLADSVLKALEDRHLIRARSDGFRTFELQHPGLAQALWRLGKARWPARRSEPTALMHAAEIALSTGETDLAERHASDALRAYPETDLRARAKALSFLGNVALQEGCLSDAAERYDEAASMFAALGLTENVGWLLAAVGMLKLSMGDQGAAVEKLSAASNRVPGDPRIQTELARALWHTGQKQAALAVLSGVLKRDGDRAEALRTRGEILADMGEAESAIRDLERVGSHLRPSALAARALALARLSQRDSARREEAEEASAELDKVLRRERHSGPVLFRAAQVRLIEGDARTATELASRAVDATDPPLPPHQEVEAHRLMEEAHRLLHRM